MTYCPPSTKHSERLKVKWKNNQIPRKKREKCQFV